MKTTKTTDYLRVISTYTHFKFNYFSKLILLLLTNSSHASGNITSSVISQWHTVSVHINT